MAISKEYLEFVVDQFRAWADVDARRMFGGAGLFRDGTMFGLVANDCVYLKVADENRADFEAVGAEPFRPYKDKSRVMSYYEVPADVLESPPALVDWAQTAYHIACRTTRRRSALQWGARRQNNK